MTGSIVTILTALLITVRPRRTSPMEQPIRDIYGCGEADTDTMSVMPVTSSVQVEAMSTQRDHSGARGDDDRVRLWIAGRPASTQGAYLGDTAKLLGLLRSNVKWLRTATLADVQGYVDTLQGTAANAERVTTGFPWVPSRCWFRNGTLPLNACSVTI
jgi:hypothetical protein